ncbi:Protein YceI [Pedobacter sp. Bi27]|uniref:YceI family protein n=1 Tax=unclassified Pedobacter TaxID=2628915 RepID=UPI001DCA4132|nr:MULTISPECIES: YceI family protein [unclassified Pedobacter]CAH0261079.1 Protein YceI [Pedobacter sp. Bi36]CAH0287879.1 Protein YceI [Pedobacter sp. Bi126]CAH0291339.1 Protein YceI [Pedobacter sp. Bi27]
METTKFEIVSAQSSINWTGKKVTGAHNGTITIKSGSLSLNDGKLSNGNFIIDTTSIVILDVTDPATNAQFAGHLFSEDFFATDQFPEATFVITAVDQTNEDNTVITGDLTIKGITHAVIFAADVVVNGNTLTASGKIFIDRTKYNMKFRSGNFFTNLGDNLIYNEFELDVKLTASLTI